MFIEPSPLPSTTSNLPAKTPSALVALATSPSIKSLRTLPCLASKTLPSKVSAKPLTTSDLATFLAISPSCSVFLISIAPILPSKTLASKPSIAASI